MQHIHPLFLHSKQCKQVLSSKVVIDLSCSHVREISAKPSQKRFHCLLLIMQQCMKHKSYFNPNTANPHDHLKQGEICVGTISPSLETPTEIPGFCCKKIAQTIAQTETLVIMNLWFMRLFLDAYKFWANFSFQWYLNGNKIPVGF